MLKLNPHLVAWGVLFAQDGKDEEYLVQVESDGETTTFTRPDGTRLYCDSAALAAVVGGSGNLPPGVGYGPRQGFLEGLDAPPIVTRSRFAARRLVSFSLAAVLALGLPAVT